MPMTKGRNLPKMTDRNNDVVAYSFTVTPVTTGDLDSEELAEPFDMVQFEHPDENYGKYAGFEVSNVTELIER